MGVFSENADIRWYDYLWLLIPIAGIAIMDAAVSERGWAKERLEREKIR